MYPESRPGQFYLIDTECVNGGIPYGENFYVVNRFCIARVSSSKCRLRITSQIKYRKNVWGIVRSFIEKNASAGIVDTFTVLGQLWSISWLKLLHGDSWELKLMNWWPA